MKQITQLVLPDNLEVDILFENGKLAYVFEHDGQNYGISVPVPSRKVVDIATACLILLTNAIETKKELLK